MTTYTMSGHCQCRILQRGINPLHISKALALPPVHRLGNGCHEHRYSRVKVIVDPVRRRLITAWLVTRRGVKRRHGR